MASLQQKNCFLKKKIAGRGSHFNVVKENKNCLGPKP
jgi:hypothetical protein